MNEDEYDEDDFKPFIRFCELVKQNSNLKKRLEIIENELTRVVTSNEFKKSMMLIKSEFPDEFEKLKLAILGE